MITIERYAGQQANVNSYLLSDANSLIVVRIPMWHGWHAARRGLGTNLYRLGVSDKVIQAILRHSNVNVTLGYYIKPQKSDVIAAMGKFEQQMAAHSFRDSNGTVNQASGAMPKSLN